MQLQQLLLLQTTITMVIHHIIKTVIQIQTTTRDFTIIIIKDFIPIIIMDMLRTTVGILTVEYALVGAADGGVGLV